MESITQARGKPRKLYPSAGNAWHGAQIDYEDNMKLSRENTTSLSKFHYIATTHGKMNMEAPKWIKEMRMWFLKCLVK